MSARLSDNRLLITQFYTSLFLALPNDFQIHHSSYQVMNNVERFFRFRK